MRRNQYTTNNKGHALVLCAQMSLFVALFHFIFLSSNGVTAASLPPLSTPPLAMSAQEENVVVVVVDVVKKTKPLCEPLVCARECGETVRIVTLHNGCQACLCEKPSTNTHTLFPSSSSSSTTTTSSSSSPSMLSSLSSSTSTSSTRLSLHHPQQMRTTQKKHRSHGHQARFARGAGSGDSEGSGGFESTDTTPTTLPPTTQTHPPRPISTCTSRAA